MNLEKGDLPLRTSFPILTSNVLNWFADEKGDLKEAESAGNIVEVDLPSSGDWALTKPDGTTVKLPASDNAVTVGPLDLCGVWSIKDAAGEMVRSIACNLSSTSESDLRPASDLPMVEADTTPIASFLDRPLWFYLVVLGAVIMVAEWYLYQRRWIS